MILIYVVLALTSLFYIKITVHTELHTMCMHVYIHIYTCMNTYMDARKPSTQAHLLLNCVPINNFKEQMLAV